LYFTVECIGTINAPLIVESGESSNCNVAHYDLFAAGGSVPYLKREAVLVLQQQVAGSVPAPRGVVLVLQQQAAGSVRALSRK
jgi:hypothetical protein